jgi:sigma-B regulation protein RsbU (phosphoserine phosphatase)
MSRINTFLSDRAEHGKYATMFYSMVNVSGRLSYANAGHCAPLLVRASGAIEKLAPTTTPVGLVPGARFDLAYQDLAPGDRIVLYTDGVTEARNGAGEFFGRKGLLEAVRRAGAAGCNELHDAIQAAILEFTAGADQEDDVTLVVVEYRGL